VVTATLKAEPNFKVVGADVAARSK
jgi:hypothetical protein